MKARSSPGSAKRGLSVPVIVLLGLVIAVGGQPAAAWLSGFVEMGPPELGVITERHIFYASHLWPTVAGAAAIGIGLLSDRYGHVRAVTLGLLAFGLGSLGISVASDTLTLLGLVIVAWIAGTVSLANAQAVIYDHESGTRATRAIAIFFFVTWSLSSLTAASVRGPSVASPDGSLLNAAYSWLDTIWPWGLREFLLSWRGTILLTAIAAFVVLILAWRYLQDTKSRDEGAAPNEPPSMALDRNFWGLALIAAAAPFAFFGSYKYTWAHSKGFEYTTPTEILVASHTALPLGAMLALYIATNPQRERLLRYGVWFLIAAVLFDNFFINDPPSMLPVRLPYPLKGAFVVFVGITAGMIVPIATAAALEARRHQPAVAAGALIMVTPLPILLIFLVQFTLIDYIYAHRAVFALLILLIGLRLSRRPRLS